MGKNLKPSGAIAAVLIAGSGLLIGSGMTPPMAVADDNTSDSAPSATESRNADGTPTNSNQSDDSVTNTRGEDPATTQEDFQTQEVIRPDWTVNSIKLEYDPASNGYHAQLSTRGFLPVESMTVMDANNQAPAVQLQLQPLSGEQTADTELGAVHVSGTARYVGSYAGSSIMVEQPYSYTAGKAISATYTGTALAFTPAGDLFEAATTADMSSTDNGPSDPVVVDGVSHSVSWGDLWRQETAGTTTLTRVGRVEGDIPVGGHTQYWRVTITATRTESRVIGLNLIRTNSSGETSTTPIADFAQDKPSYEMTLPADAATDALSLGIVSSSDTAITEMQTSPVQVNDDGSRVLSISAGNNTYIVTVQFQQSPAPVDTASKARLDGIYVNYSGRPVKGELIPGWNPDTTDYTLTIDKDAPGVYVLPVAPTGVTVKAADVRQTGYATEQAWKVTAQNGSQQRTYTVRAVRRHDKPTASEAFSPSAFKDAGGSDAAPDMGTTKLKSHGYMLNGTYHAVENREYVIPHGGSFAYESYVGQTVTVKQVNQAPMRYLYDLSVIAPNGMNKAEHEHFTTYLTPETHKAELQMIQINNEDVPAFNPSQTDYTVPVPNTAHWVISTKFDKGTGMSVSVHKRGDTAEISVSSADGLVRRNYTVHVVQQSEQAVSDTTAIADARDDHEMLAATGSNAFTFQIAAAVSTLLGAVSLLLSRTRKEHD